jgi:hypothetical protein
MNNELVKHELVHEYSNFKSGVRGNTTISLKYLGQEKQCLVFHCRMTKRCPSGAVSNISYHEIEIDEKDIKLFSGFSEFWKVVAIECIVDGVE